MRFEDQRKLMVENQLKARGITDERVLRAFMKVKRELFITDEWKDFTYQDHPLSIGSGQTISQPYIVALMMSLLEIDPMDRVLEIGTGSGYQTALLAEIAEEVYTIERYELLQIKAKSTLRHLGYKNIFYKCGDGSLGWVNAIQKVDQFEKIIISAAYKDVPPSLVNQLYEMGKLVMPQGDLKSQEIILYKKTNGEMIPNTNGGCVFVPLIGKEAWNNDNTEGVKFDDIKFY